MSEHERKKNDDQQRDVDPLPAFGGLIDGVANILGRLGDLAEKGESLRREVNLETKDGKDLRASYGFSIKMGADGRSSSVPQQVRPRNEARTSAKPAKNPAEHPVREPQIDIYEEEDHLLILAEMPGVPADQVDLQFEQNQLQLSGRSARLKFATSIDLPCACNPEDVAVTANNGVVEIRIHRQPSGQGE
jgi:HSP20 family protein